MSASLELEIKNLLDEFGTPADAVPRLLAYLEESEETFTPENFLATCRFLLHTGHYLELIGLILKHLETENLQIPWPYLLEALALSRPGFPPDLADCLLQALEEEDAFSEASRSKALDSFTSKMKTERADRRLQIIKRYRREKESLIEQLATLRTQQLYEQEKNLLQRLQRMYPQDPEVLKEVQNHKERYALEILSRRSSMSSGVRLDETLPDPEVESLKLILLESMKALAAHDGTLAKDLAVAAAMLEEWNDALEILSFAPAGTFDAWLRLELLLQARRFLELLQELGGAEHREASDSETFFATAYLRAQALWGLGQKHTAIEVMESLLAARPAYRSGASLLNLWRGQ